MDALWLSNPFLVPDRSVNIKFLINHLVSRAKGSRKWLFLNNEDGPPEAEDPTEPLKLATGA